MSGRVSLSPPQDPVVRRAVRVLAMVHELHKAGYQLLRISAGLSPEGTHWCCHITSADNIAENGWEVADEGEEVLSYSTSDGDLFFGVAGSPGKTARELADMFQARFPELMGRAMGQDREYAGWYVGMLGAAEHGHLPIFFSDHELEPVQEEMLPPPRIQTTWFGKIKLISNEDLRLDIVPMSNANWSDIEPFCLTFDGYAGGQRSIDECAEIFRRVTSEGLHEATLEDLRIALFFQQRKIRWNDHMPVQVEDVDLIRPVVAEVRRHLAARRDIFRALTDEFERHQQSLPVYAQGIMQRHKAAVLRMRAEQAGSVPRPDCASDMIHFEAAELVWAYYLAQGLVVEGRALRNDVAQSVRRALEYWADQGVIPITR
jgi:hypothetical protein